MVGYQIGIIGADGDQDTWFSANFQYNIVAKMRLPPGLCLGPHLRASSSPSWQTLGLTIAEGPIELRAPGPRDPTIRHCARVTCLVWIIPQTQNRCSRTTPPILMMIHFVYITLQTKLLKQSEMKKKSIIHTFFKLSQHQCQLGFTKIS